MVWRDISLMTYLKLVRPLDLLYKSKNFQYWTLVRYLIHLNVLAYLCCNILEIRCLGRKVAKRLIFAGSSSQLWKIKSKKDKEQDWLLCCSVCLMEKWMDVVIVAAVVAFLLLLLLFCCCCCCCGLRKNSVEISSKYRSTSFFISCNKSSKTTKRNNRSTKGQENIGQDF